MLIGTGFVSQPSPTYHLEREHTANGAELVTVFGRLGDPASGRQDLDVPLISVLRDSLGDRDPEDDRLRYVWILTSTRPTLWQRAASALSFGYFRAGSKHHSDRVPSPAIDLASPSRSVYSNLLGDSLQALELDPLGAAIRSTTRTYRGNSSDYSKLQVFQALTTLDNLAQESGGFASSPDSQLLPDSEFREIYSRLSLSTRTFGGLVRDQKLSTYYDKSTSQLQETRGHNWELLRQRAEVNGLIFEPLSLRSGTPSEALLWIARSDLETREEKQFDGQLLSIRNPWTDDRLMHWTGYTQVRHFDSENRLVEGYTRGGRAEEMIPLAMYSLDYPRAPLLLADFRDNLKPKRREIVRQGATGVVTGLLGITRFGNPSFFAADVLWNFVRARHGDAMNRAARLQAYSEAREFLAADSSLAPTLKVELQRQLDHLALNPRENEVANEANLAREQYAALVQYSQSSRGAAKLERDRQKELESYTQSHTKRLALKAGRFFTRGPRVDPEKPDPILKAELDAYRRSDYNFRFLEQLLGSSPSPDVVWDPHVIGKSVTALTANTHSVPQARRIIAQVYARSTDDDLRRTCLEALQHLNSRSLVAAPTQSAEVAPSSVAIRSVTAAQ